MILKWGILGPGKIAKNFAADLLLLKDKHVIQAVGSRSIERAKEFSAQFGVPSAYGSYESLLSDKEIDIIYIATPHHNHEEWAIKALNAGKHVLCEKPMGVNTLQTKRMIECAKENNRFLMEALWSRFNPTIKHAFELVNSGRIGEVKYIQADFAFSATFDPNSRLFNPELAGGATLDIGIYPIFLSYLFLGLPKEIKTSHKFAETGVDLQVSSIFSYPDSEASLYWGLNSVSPMDALISGSKGSITIHGRWHEADALTLKTETTEQIKKPRLGKGYSHEIMACYEAIQNGQNESSQWSWQNSIELSILLYSIRNQIGLSYPFE